MQAHVSLISATCFVAQGLRIDCVLCSKGLLDKVVSCEVIDNLPPKWSDHAALLVEFRDLAPPPDHAPCVLWTQRLKQFHDSSQRSIAAMFGQKRPASGTASRHVHSVQHTTGNEAAKTGSSSKPAGRTQQPDAGASEQLPAEAEEAGTLLAAGLEQGLPTDSRQHDPVQCATACSTRPGNGTMPLDDATAAADHVSAQLQQQAAVPSKLPASSKSTGEPTSSAGLQAGDTPQDVDANDRPPKQAKFKHYQSSLCTAGHAIEDPSEVHFQHSTGGNDDKAATSNHSGQQQEPASIAAQNQSEAAAAGEASTDICVSALINTAHDRMGAVLDTKLQEAPMAKGHHKPSSGRGTAGMPSTSSGSKQRKLHAFFTPACK